MQERPASPASAASWLRLLLGNLDEHKTA